jgi:hypothetical protein
VIVPGDKDADGTTFVGSFYHSDINNAGVVAASMIIETDQGRCQQGTPCEGKGHAVYTVSRQNQIRKVAAPGDPAPGEKKFFDEAVDSNINDRGDVVFGGHVKGEVCLAENREIPIGCFESLYLYTASTGEIKSIAHTGDPAPRGDKFAIAFMGMPNNSGDIAFIGSTSTKDPLANTGVYLWRGQSGVVEAVAIPGDALPGGGHMTRATTSQCCVDVNKAGEVAFAAQLDTDDDEDRIKDTGVFVKLGGSLRRVVRTGDVLPDIGTVRHVNWTFAPRYASPICEPQRQGAGSHPSDSRGRHKPCDRRHPALGGVRRSGSGEPGDQWVAQCGVTHLGLSLWLRHCPPRDVGEAYQKRPFLRWIEPSRAPFSNCGRLRKLSGGAN